MALVTAMNLSITATKTKTLDLTAPTDPLAINERISLSTGTGAGKADLSWHDTRTLAASGTEDLDLVGTLLDAFGDTFTPVRIKAIWLKAAAANTNNVVVGGASATQWAALLGTAGTVTLRPGAQFFAAAGEADATGYVCAAGATDLLKVLNSAAGTSVTYSIALIGVSA